MYKFVRSKFIDANYMIAAGTFHVLCEIIYNLKYTLHIQVTVFSCEKHMKNDI